MHLQVHSFPVDYGRFYHSLDQFGDSGKNSQKIYTKTHKITFFNGFVLQSKPGLLIWIIFYICLINDVSS